LPTQEQGLRPARAIPYELQAFGTLNAASSAFGLQFLNTGKVGAVFEVRSGNPADNVRMYTVEPTKSLADTWNINSSYDLSVYSANGFFRHFTGRVGANAAVLNVVSSYAVEAFGSIGWKITNAGTTNATVTVLDAYSGAEITRFLRPGESFQDQSLRQDFFGWYDLIVTVAEDPTFKYRLAGHVETGFDSVSDPALGGFVLKG
jgi:phospholipase C